jgi:hypothetical protein
MLGESGNRFFLIRSALSNCGRAIRYPRLFHLAASLLLLLPVSLQAADHFTMVDLGKAPNTEHAKAFAETIGFDTWFAQPHCKLLPSDTSASLRFAVGCNRRGFKYDGLELWFVTSPFQPPRVWDAHY